MNQTVEQILREMLERVAREYGVQINSLDARWVQHVGLPSRLLAVEFQAKATS